MTYGVRVLRSLGVRSMVFTNAAGGINLTLERGGLVLISRPHQPAGLRIRWSGRTTMRWGRAFPDMSEAYSQQYREIAKTVAAELCIPIDGRRVRGDARARATKRPRRSAILRTIGADVVGMSTVPEVIVANHMGMKVLGISCVTNMAAGILPQKINHEEVLETGAMVRDTLVRFLKALLPRLARRRDGRPADRRRARGARENALRAVLEIQGGRGARGCRRAHPHRLQRRERHLRPDDLRRARGGVQGDLRRRRASSAASRWRPTPTSSRRPAAPAGRSSGNSAATSKSCW